MSLTTVQGELLESGSALENIGAGNITPSYLNTQAQYTGFKNRIINGNMVIDQRNAGASVTPTTTSYPWPYCLDRWNTAETQASKFSVQQNAGSVTPPVGFTKYLGVTSLSAYSVTSSDIFLVQQRIEGYNVADFGFGTASASTVTLSFWVRSSLTGTFGGSFGNVNDDRSYPFSYTISAANTWEQKTITVAGDTTGTWGTTTGIGLTVTFGLGSGSTYSGTAGAWTSGLKLSATGATSVVGTNGATFYITGVQLEKGSVATSFDYRPYGTELQLCQRYCHVWSSGGESYRWVGVGFSYGSGATAHYRFPVIMRTSPTVSFSEQNKWIVDYAGGNATSTGMAGTWQTVEQCRINMTVSTVNNYPIAIANNGDAGTRWIRFEAEL